MAPAALGAPAALVLAAALISLISASASSTEQGATPSGEPTPMKHPVASGAEPLAFGQASAPPPQTCGALPLHHNVRISGDDIGSCAGCATAEAC